MAKITMAISRNTTNFNRRIKFAKEKTDDRQNANGDDGKAARCSKRWAVLVDRFLEFESDAQS